MPAIPGNLYAYSLCVIIITTTGDQDFPVPLAYRLSPASRACMKKGKRAIGIGKKDYSGFKTSKCSGHLRDYKTSSRVGVGFLVPILANNHPARGYQPHRLLAERDAW